MNYLIKIIDKVSIALIPLGFFLMLGGVGNSDYADEIGVYCPLSDILIPCLIGAFMMIAGTHIQERWFAEDEDC